MRFLVALALAIAAIRPSYADSPCDGNVVKILDKLLPKAVLSSDAQDARATLMLMEAQIGAEFVGLSPFDTRLCDITLRHYRDDLAARLERFKDAPTLALKSYMDPIKGEESCPLAYDVKKILKDGTPFAMAADTDPERQAATRSILEFIRLRVAGLTPEQQGACMALATASSRHYAEAVDKVRCAAMGKTKCAAPPWKKAASPK